MQFSITTRYLLSSSFRLLSLKLLPEVISATLVMFPRQCEPSAADKWALNAGNGGPTRWDSKFLSQFMPKSPTQCQLRAFYSQAQTQPCCFHPSGEHTNLPGSHPFCRRYQRTMLEVTSQSCKSCDTIWRHWSGKDSLHLTNVPHYGCSKLKVLGPCQVEESPWTHQNHCDAL